MIASDFLRVILLLFSELVIVSGGIKSVDEDPGFTPTTTVMIFSNDIIGEDLELVLDNSVVKNPIFDVFSFI